MNKVYAFAVILLVFFPHFLWAEVQSHTEGPVVSNVSAEQIDFEHVRIRYDLLDPDGDPMLISVKVSDDGGQTFEVVITGLEGDVGEGINGGIGKEIIWTIGTDLELNRQGDNFVARVIADDLKDHFIRVEPHTDFLFDKTSIPTAFAHLYGNPDVDLPPLVKVEIFNYTETDTSITISVEVPGYSTPGLETVILDEGQTHTTALSPTFNKEIVSQINEITPADILVTRTSAAHPDDIYMKTIDINLLSRNTMIWAFSPLVVVFVTPGDSQNAVQDLVSMASKYTPNTGMIGYQPKTKEYVIGQIKVWDLWPFFWHFEDVIERRDMSHREIVEEQISAIYIACQNMGFRYVNTPYSYESGHQTIKYPQETLSDTNGNCIDLTVMFASAFELLGMRPRVILVQGHAFVGCHIWSDSNECVYLETTMIGDFSAEAAIKQGQLLFESESNQNTIIKNIDVKEMRQYGITPAPL